MVSKILNLIALSALALLAGSYGNTPVNALSLDSGHLHARHNHDLLVKRATPRRCKPRSSTPAQSNTKADSPPATTPAAPQPSQNPPTTNNPPASNSGAKAGLAWAAGDNVPILQNFKTSHVGAYVPNSDLSPSRSLTLLSFPFIQYLQLGSFQS